MLKVSPTQKSAMIYLFNRPHYMGSLPKQTGDALVRKGYALKCRYKCSHRYVLTNAGQRFNQTGKLIGE